MNFYKLIWSVVVFLFLTSCHKNWFTQKPLDEVPTHLTEGVVKTGSEQFANFEDFIVSRMLRLTLNSQSDQVLRFQEGEERVYQIQLDFLAEFDSKYEILDLENPFSDLDGSQWIYNSKTKTGELRWTPDKTFNKGDMYKQFNISIPVKLRKKTQPLKNSTVTAVKKIDFFVYKSTYKPEITALRTKYNSYIKLDDGLFYETTGVKLLNLNHYKRFFTKITTVENESTAYSPDFYLSYPDELVARGVGGKGLKEDSSSDSEIAKKELEEVNPNNILHKDIFKPVDENSVELPYSILFYVKRPYYELVESSTRLDCVSYQSEDKCWIQLTNIEELPITKQVYVKNYIVPKSLDIENLYYKVDSAIECKIYDKLGYIHKIKDDVFNKSFKESQEQFCYVPVKETDVFQNSLISEERSIYLLEGESLKALDITKWEESYFKIPLFLKFQMSGHQPVKEFNILYMNAANNNSLKFEIKDENYFESHPNLYFENIMNQKLYSLLPVQFRLQSASKIDDSTFLVKLSFNVEEHQDYKEYSFQIVPKAETIKGDFLNFKVSVFPFLLEEKEYFFNPILGLTKTVYTANDKWDRTEINLETQLKRRYTFPQEFYSKLDVKTPITSSQSLKNQLLFDNPSPSERLCRTLVDSSFLLNRDCSCSKDTFYEDEEKNIYMESTCSHSIKLQILPSHIEDNHSAYVQYEYDIKDQSLAIPSIDIDLNHIESKRVISIQEKKYLINETLNQDIEKNQLESTKSEIKKDEVKLKTYIHLFLNLQPSWKCESTFESDTKSCTFSYNINKSIPSSSIDNLIKSFLGEHVLIDTKCFSKDDSVNTFNKEYPCNCTAIDVTNSGFNLNCDFKSDALLELKLKTAHPHIYFFDKEEKGNKQTSLKRININ